MGEESARKKQPKIFRLGDTVRIMSGPFAAFTGKIEGINEAKRLLKVRVLIYGRSTIKLNFSDAQTVTFENQQ